MNNDVTIHLSKGMKVRQAFYYAGVHDPSSVQKLTVRGMMDNYQYREMIDLLCETLITLDLKNVMFEKDEYLWSFTECPCLISIIFPASITRIEDVLFSRWSSLNHISVHDDNAVFSSENGILFSKDGTILVRYPTGRKGHYTIPDTVVEIGGGAFDKCKGLTSVTIPHSVVKISYNAFANCQGLTSVVIPESVVSLGREAFYNCTELTAVDMPKSLKYRKNRVFDKCEKLPIIKEERNIEIKQGKINQLQKMSAYEWINMLLKNSKYPYLIEDHHKTKLQLYIMVTDRLKLEIAIPNRHFQTMIPKLMDTIQRYEACIKENDIKVLITDTSYDKEYWENKSAGIMSGGRRN